MRGSTEDATVVHFAACAIIAVASCDIQAAGFAHQLADVQQNALQPSSGVGVASSLVIDLKSLQETRLGTTDSHRSSQVICFLINSSSCKKRPNCGLLQT